ncbi:TIGR02588 family protein [Rhizobium sp. NFR07]|jgi:uncharacterized protein (TIGR02588 family)|uniref:TIGR02588 family protein n=1 Tax=Rhizobium sp. NFR07 TaxID=1566262 RepID=UPI0008F3CB19|nr:TIGR02588 family protein [Rhizobium sp. NFR07]SFA78473.1 TIGR02588 family protein [Rhizobium sp. NFR07]
MARPQKTRSRNAPVSKPAGKGTASTVEWVTGLISAFIVLVMICWVAWEALTEVEAPPAFAVTVRERQAVEGGYRVTFDIANASSQTAATVVVRGEIVDGDTTVEDADITFDYVPGQSKASGSIFFSQDPGSRPIRLRAVGYTEP